MKNTYINVCITYRAAYRETVCSWEYFQTTIIQNQCTLNWHSKNNKLKSKNRTEKEVSVEFILNFVKKKISKPSFSVEFWGRMCHVSEMSFSRLRMRQIYLRISIWEQRQLEHASDLRNLWVERENLPLLHVVKHGCQKIKFSKGWKLPKKQKNRRSWPKKISKMKFPVIRFSVFSVKGTEDLISWCWSFLVGPPWHGKRRRTRINIEKAEKRTYLLYLSSTINLE